MTASTLCPRCATPLPSAARFCPGCGATTPTGFTPSTGRAEEIPKRESDLSARQAELQAALGASWEIRELIGQGGFGEVWSAWDTRLKRDVAIKALRSDLVASESMLARFQREAEAVARLRHPNIVPIYQVGEAAGLAYFIMPLVRGESLYDLLKREGKLSLDDARRVLKESASALDAAHKADIVHRDIKPENIMLDGDERRVLLMDFGIARALGSDEGRLTGTGLVIGTPQYMSPEQASAEKNVDHRSDIYSLGVVAYQSLAGRLPFDSNSARELVIHHITTEPDDLRKLRPDVPDDLHDAVMKCLRKAPEDRFASAGELAKAVQPVTAAVPPMSGARRFVRRVFDSRGTRLRIAAYIGVFVAALVLVNNANDDAVMRAWYRWNKRQMPSAVEARPNLPGFRAIWDFVAGQRYRLRDLQLASLHDTTLLVSSPVGGPMLFNGTTWRGLDVPTAGWIYPPAVLADSIWIAAGGPFPGISILYLVTNGGAVARDTIRHRVSAVWSDGKTILLGADDGAILRGRPGQWRLEPTGRTDRITAIWGDSARQFGIQNSQLLSFNGINWRRVEVQSDSSVTARVSTGAMLGDGTAAMIVVWRPTAGGKRRLRVHLRDRTSERWTVTDAAGIPDSMDLYGIWGTSPSDYYVYGAAAEPACDAVPCLYHVAKGDARPIPHVHGDFHVIGVASLRGVPHVLASSGAVWTVRDNEWGAVSEVPSSIFRGVAVAPTNTRIAWGQGILAISNWRAFAPRQRADVRKIVIANDPKAGTEVIWILTESGVLSRIDCSSFSRDCRDEVMVAAPDRRRVLDIAAGADNRLRVAGEQGLLAVRNGQQWAAVGVAPGSVDPGEAIVSVFARANRVTLALTSRRILLAAPSGAFKAWHDLGPSVGKARQVIAIPSGGAAVLGEGGVFVVTEDGNTREVPACANAPTSMDVLDDGRILVGCARPDDPLAGGQLFIARVRADGFVESRNIAIQNTLDVYGIASVSPNVHVVGSGGFWLTARDSKLPLVTFVNVFLASRVRGAHLFVPVLGANLSAEDSTTAHALPSGRWRLLLRSGTCIIWDSTVNLQGLTELRLGTRDRACKS